ncbi:MAG TPA: hypothetical protein VJ717_16985 [Gemmatimonadaceae bacterium]|nr:hypothetical protein [Gemmatimonadaceae bacterium]
MPALNIVLAGTPRLFGEIVSATLTARPDVAVAADVRNRSDLPDALDATGATLAIVALEPNESPAVFGDLLRARPELSLLAITADSHAAFLCELRLQMAAIELSPSALLQALSAREDLNRSLHLISVQRSIAGTGSFPDVAGTVHTK